MTSKLNKLSVLALASVLIASAGPAAAREISDHSRISLPRHTPESNSSVKSFGTAGAEAIPKPRSTLSRDGAEPTIVVPRDLATEAHITATLSDPAVADALTRTATAAHVRIDVSPSGASYVTVSERQSVHRIPLIMPRMDDETALNVAMVANAATVTNVRSFEVDTAGNVIEHRIDGTSPVYNDAQIRTLPPAVTLRIRGVQLTRVATR